MRFLLSGLTGLLSELGSFVKRIDGFVKWTSFVKRIDGFVKWTRKFC